jgi:hypothetical protein
VLALPAIGDVQELPDGRWLVDLDDGKLVVVGRARPYPHPVPGCDWLPARSRGRPPRVAPAPRRRPPQRYRIVPGARALWPHPYGRVAAARAETLLRSLLTAPQLRDWQTCQRFWVDTPRGPVRLGDLYWLRHWPIDEPDIERQLCVVPNHYGDLAPADIWVNLLLVLAVEPETFFRVAIERGCCLRPRSGGPGSG